MYTRQQTHSGVLPQLRTLESVSADNPQRRNETGYGRRKAPGVQHGRGETAVMRRHPDGQPSGDRGLAAPIVFILDRNGVPLQPCSPARARQLLTAGRAVVAHRTPFVIRLKDRIAVTSTVTGVEIGIDPGSKFTGIAIYTDTVGVRTGLYSIEIRHRGQRISKALMSRAARRHGRRSRNLRYRERRFSNRVRPKGWLAPSLQHRVVGVMSWVTRLAKWAPVAGLHVERVAFDTQLIQNPEITGVEYQQGTLYATELRQYLLEKWHRTCAYCGTKDVALNLDHIVPKARGGSNRASNLTLACIPCNKAKGARPVEEFLSSRPLVLARVLRQAKAPLRDAATVSSTRRALWRALTAAGFPVEVATGGRTKWNRQRTGSPKTHTLDALHVGTLDTVDTWPIRVMIATSTGRGKYARTTSDRYGFPRLCLKRTKRHYGYATGDLIRAVVPKGVKAGTYIGRVTVRARGVFDITTAGAFIQSVHHRHIQLLQRADGWAYAFQREGTSVNFNDDKFHSAVNDGISVGRGV